MNTQVSKVEPADLQVVRPRNPSKEVLMFDALNAAIERGTDPDILEKMLDMQIRVMDRQNEQAYNKAMRLAQQKMPAVVSDSDNTHTRSRYPKLARITQVCSPVYFKNGFNCSFDTGDDAPEGHIRVLCYVSHTAGHTRTYHLDVPVDLTGPSGKANKTATHGTISAVTYGQSRLMRMIWNVRVIDDPEDDDGNQAGAPPVERISEHEVANLEAFIEEVKLPIADFMKHFKLQELSGMPRAMLPLANKMLEKRRHRMGEVNA